MATNPASRRGSARFFTLDGERKLDAPRNSGSIERQPTFQSLQIDYIKRSEWDQRLDALIREALESGSLGISVPYTGSANGGPVFGVCVETELKRWTLPLSLEKIQEICTDLDIPFDSCSRRPELDNAFKNLTKQLLPKALLHLRPTAEQVISKSPDPPPRSRRQNAERTPVNRSRRASLKLRIENFELLKVLGKGGYGCVYLSRKKDTGEILALKKMSKEFVTNRNLVDAVKTERSVLVNATQTKSPWLVQLHYSFHDERHLFIAMEYVPGGDVRYLLDKVLGLGEEDAAFYFAEMVVAVSVLHAHGFTHRDLKPDNFLIDSQGHLKLADFGLSRSGATAKRQNPGSVSGTPNYMAPEIIRGEAQDEGVDWWALGCILYELIVGLPPFNGETPDEVFDKVVSFEKTLEYSHNGEDLFSPEAKTVLESLLCPSASRLGRNGPEDFKPLAFFSKIDWDKLRDLAPPFIPQLENETDSSYFAADIPLVPLTPAPTPTNQAFAGFTFNPSACTPIPFTPASTPSTPMGTASFYRIRKVLFQADDGTESPKRPGGETGITPIFKRQRICFDVEEAEQENKY